MSTDTRWRCGLFQPDIAHLPDPDTPGSALRRRVRHAPAWCGRYLRKDMPADADTLRCPDCAAAEAEAVSQDRNGGAVGPMHDRDDRTGEARR